MNLTLQLSDEETALLREQALQQMQHQLEPERRKILFELKCLTIEQVCEALNGVTPRVAKNLLAKYRIAEVDLGHRTKRYRAKDIEDLIQRRLIKPAYKHPKVRVVETTKS